MNTIAPVSLYDIIAWVETKNCPHLLRFEPAVYNRNQDAWGSIFDKIKLANQCSDYTARMIYSTSFGAIQMMGFNLYGLGYDKGIVEFCDDQIAQAAIFDRFIDTKGIRCTPDDLANFPLVRNHFARVYNGNPAAYEPMIVDSLRHFNFKVEVINAAPNS